MSSISQIHKQSTLAELVSALCHANCALWHAEDKARSTDDLIVASAKREVDAWNQTRNDLIERIDDLVIQLAERKPTENIQSLIQSGKRAAHG